MPDFHGPIQSFAVMPTLWLILLFPAAAALYCGARALRRQRIDAQGRQAIATLSIGAIGLSFALSAYHAYVLASKGADERFLVQHLWRMVRVGQLDASFDLAFDPLSATMALVVTGIGLPIFVFSSSYMEAEARYARFFAWLNGFVASMLLLVLADNFVLLLFGWEGVGLCSWGLIGFWWPAGEKASAGRKAFLVNRIGDAGLVLGIALLYWGLGGTWADGDYVPDLNPRFSSVDVSPVAPSGLEVEPGAPPAMPAGAGAGEGAPTPSPPEAALEEGEEPAPALPSTAGEGLLTLGTYSGAVVFMDDARTPLKDALGEIARAPFSRLRVRGGIHSFRIHPGGGIDDFLVTHVAFGEKREIALASFGPSVTFRNVQDQLAAHDVHGHAPVREALLTKRIAGGVTVLTLACILLFVGAVGKSAQFPLYVWLPDAMAGPTPVSALIHAATMVTAGVYLVARLSFLFVLSSPACAVVAVVGAGTSLFAATMGLYQYDLKRILAYSTVSQLGLMMLGVGVGAYAAGVFHLVTHACFKACLFLSAGATIHALHGREEDEDEDRTAWQDVRKLRRLGGLKHAMPKTARAYFIGCLAITAAPIPGLAGFWSKDDILVFAFRAQGVGGSAFAGPALGAIALLGAGLTSFYMWRSWYLVFGGEGRELALSSHPQSPDSPDATLPRNRGRAGVGAERARAHDGPPAMTGALTVLAGLSVVAGAIGIGGRLFGKGGESLLEAWLAPVLRDAHAPFAPAGAAVEWGVIGAAYAVAIGGWALARARYAERPEARAASDDWEARERRAPLFAASTHGWWLDAVYTHTVVAFAGWSSAFIDEFDHRVIDGLVNAGGGLARVLAWSSGGPTTRWSMAPSARCPRGRFAPGDGFVACNRGVFRRMCS
jgi:NADH-quinone oxidoreductase subunit L